MITQLVYLSVSPEDRDALVFEALENARQSLMEVGVRRFDVLQQTDDLNKLVLYEAYDSPEALEAHRRTIHFTCWQTTSITTTMTASGLN